MGLDKFVEGNTKNAREEIVVDRRPILHMLIAFAGREMNSRQASLWNKVADEIGMGLDDDGNIVFMPYTRETN